MRKGRLTPTRIGTLHRSLRYQTSSGAHSSAQCRCKFSSISFSCLDDEVRVFSGWSIISVVSPWMIVSSVWKQCFKRIFVKISKSSFKLPRNITNNWAHRNWSNCSNHSKATKVSELVRNYLLNRLSKRAQSGWIVSSIGQQGSILPGIARVISSLWHDECPGHRSRIWKTAHWIVSIVQWSWEFEQFLLPVFPMSILCFSLQVSSISLARSSTSVKNPTCISNTFKPHARQGNWKKSNVFAENRTATIPNEWRTSSKKRNWPINCRWSSFVIDSTSFTISFSISIETIWWRISRFTFNE